MYLCRLFTPSLAWSPTDYEIVPNVCKWQKAVKNIKISASPFNTDTIDLDIKSAQLGPITSRVSFNSLAPGVLNL